METGSKENILWKFGVEAETQGPLLWIPLGYIEASSRVEALAKLSEWSNRNNLDDYVFPVSRRGKTRACLDIQNPVSVIML